WEFRSRKARALRGHCTFPPSGSTSQPRANIAPAQTASRLLLCSALVGALSGTGEAILELADPLAEAATKIGQLPGPEDDQDDQENEKQMCRLKQPSTHRSAPSNGTERALPLSRLSCRRLPI